MRAHTLLCAIAILARAASAQLGGITSINTSDGPMLAALDAGITLMNAQSNALNWQQSTNVLAATRQVTNGNKYTIQIQLGTTECPRAEHQQLPTLEECPVTGDTSVHELVVLDNGSGAPRYTLMSHQAVEPVPLMGSPTEIDRDDHAMLEALGGGVSLLNAQSNSLMLKQANRVIKAFRQVVAGSKYIIQVEMGATACTKSAYPSSSPTLEQCPVTGQLEYFSLEILDQAWMNPRYTLLSSTDISTTGAAPDTSTAVPVLGGVQELNVDSTEVTEVLNAALRLFNAQTNSALWQQAAEMVSATRQLVSGLKYTLRVHLGDSACSKHVNDTSVEACPLYGATQLHEMELLDQAWGSPRFTLLSAAMLVIDPIPAEPAPIADGPQVVSATDSDMLAALQAGMLQWPTHKLYQAVSVVQATVEVADGLIWTMVVQLGQTNCPHDSLVLHNSSECPVTKGDIYKKVVVQDNQGSYRLISPQCAMFKCQAGCRTYAVNPDTLCQDGCTCAVQDNSTPDSATEDDENHAAITGYAVAIGLGAAALLLVPAWAFWYVRMRPGEHAAELVLTEEPQIASPSSSKMEEGHGLVSHSQL